MIKKLKPIHKSIAALLATGKSIDETAEQCGISVHRIYQLNSDPAFSAYVDKLADAHAMQTIQAHANAEAKLTDAIDSAVDRLSFLMANAKSETVQEKASLDILHLAGLKPKDKVDITQNTIDHLVMTDPTAIPDEWDDEDIDDDEDDIDGSDINDDDVMAEVRRIMGDKDN